MIQNYTGLLQDWPDEALQMPHKVPLDEDTLTIEEILIQCSPTVHAPENLRPSAIFQELRVVCSKSITTHLELSSFNV